ncbi:t1pks [Neopestalotiopsis sp. 37M]|nr:t1pks [Neopestalotiopsis sp. 37M]
MAQSATEGVMVFGPQCLSLDQELGHWLRDQLLNDPELHWALESLRSLHSYAHDISSGIPILHHLDLDDVLQRLSSWLQIGVEKENILHWPLSNTILTPLTVTLHLVQFLQGTKQPYLSQNTTKLADGCASLKLPGKVPEILGLFDATDLSLRQSERAFSCSVSWTHSKGHQILKEIISNFPSIYVSVIQNERKVTLTGPQAQAEGLLRRLRGSSFTATEIPLQGFFHWKGHVGILNSAIALCASNADFQLGCSSKDNDYKHASSTKSSEVLLREILVDQADWYSAFTSEVFKDGVYVTCFGTERCVPAHVKRDVLVTPPCLGTAKTKSAALGIPENSMDIVDGYKNHVAIVGMGCQLPGAADMTEFWDLLCSATSQHTEIPPDRFTMDTPWRKAGDRMYYGNFIQDHDMFDARFFKKSPREAASMDPQQRLILQVAYQAVQQSGYFSGSRDKNIGCYIAFGLSDYEGNIACHPANAYAATGNLKAFSASRISHHFGWTGPGLTVDTACSSSAVALHMACQSILHGECSAALVGGVNIMTGPDWFHNLGAASFLSPTGQCKPFDAAADGYCRGEAVGAVFLKSYAAAVRDGDQVFGTIPATRVQQNANTTAITVPNAPSLVDLFEPVLEQSLISPRDITYVEAHGTGTPVGDPAEYDAVRRVLGGPVRTRENELSVGAVKGLFGHAESASGIVALLKVIAMLHFKCIPPQASFDKMSPMLRGTPADYMDISTVRKPWDAGFKAAMINNYGASGSNAALIVAQPPPRPHTPKGHISPANRAEKSLPFAIYASDEPALRRNAAKLASFIRANPKLALSDISFALSHQCNRELPMLLSFSCDNNDQLLQSLDACDSTRIVNVHSPRPVILCFGGQSSRFVGLDKQIYQNTAIFRAHLDECNAICQDLGLSIYPAIFQTKPIADLVQLHAALFSIQYASARSWLECMPGVEVAGVVGHSFGELTAMCIAGAVSLEDMLRFVTGRARLIAERWGAEKGSMLAVEGDIDIVQALLAESAQLHQSDQPASIACFNSPTRVTVAGSDEAIAAFIKAARARPPSTSVKMKDLDVNNAYHCSLADPILPALRELASQIEFRKPQIHIEHACASPESVATGSDMLVNHLRQPVYFYQAVQRLAARHKSAVWLEAGSNSGVTGLAKLTLDSMKSEASMKNHCQPVSLREGSSLQGLPDATVALWQNGINATFWQHHGMQTNEYSRILLPPYQFEKVRHWVDRKAPLHVESLNQERIHVSETLWSFLGFLDKQGRSAEFRLNTDSPRYRTIVDGHVVAKAQPLCPSTLQLDIVIEALMSLQPSFSDGTHLPRVFDTVNRAPLVLSITDTVYINARAVSDDKLIWEWSICNGKGVEAAPSTMTIYAAGKIEFCRAAALETIKIFSQYERLVRRERVLDLLHDHSIDVIQGQKHLYKLFSQYVEYDPMFRGLQRLVARGEQESAATISLASPRASWHDFAMMDCFCQVAGIFINVMTERSGDEMFISDRIDQVLPSPNQGIVAKAPPASFDVYACHQQPSDEELVSDVFVFDSVTGALVMVILGIHYRKVSRTGFSKALLRMSSGAPSTVPKTADTSRIITNPHVRYGTERRSAHRSDQERLLPPTLLSECQTEVGIVPSTASDSSEPQTPQQSPSPSEPSTPSTPSFDLIPESESDGIQLIFGTPEGRDLASGMYATSPINTAWLAQLEDFMRGLLPQLSQTEPIQILEMGAGTGGTSCRMIPLLADLGIPVKYTFSDISASLVAAARRRFNAYSFVDYRVLDIEADPPADILQSYHAVIATNCIHATKSLTRSTENIRHLLRPDGFLLMLEMTESLLWVDVVFGLLDGWWTFDDGRKHALANPQTWQKALSEAGYGQVEWTEGSLPESRYQRLILAVTSGQEKGLVANGKQDSTASTLIEFLDDHFERMSCGGIILDTQQAQTVSPTLREARPVGDQVVQSYVRFWKEVGFLEV